MPRESAPVVVGVDGSEASLAALRWAAGEAAAHGAPLIAVHVLDPRERAFAPYATPDGPDADSRDGVASAEQLLCDNGIDDVRSVFEIGNPGQVLVRSTIGARMLVLGHADHHHRREGAAPHDGPALGTIARACVAHATCPVVVVPLPERLCVRRPAEPEPRRIPAAQCVPPVGGRAIYPAFQRVPIGRG